MLAMKTSSFRSWTVILLMTLPLIYSCEKKDEPNPNTPGANEPSISSFSPTESETGEKITIKGYFPGAGVYVKFNDVIGVLLSISSTQIEVKVPDQAISGPISVVLPSITLESATPFNVKPKITNINPYAAVVGSTIEITGTGFNPDLAVLKFNGQEETPTSISRVRITATVPPGVGEGPLTVTVGNHTAISPNPFMAITSSAIGGGGPGDQYAHRSVTDASGNTYMTGKFTGSITSQAPP